MYVTNKTDSTRHIYVRLRGDKLVDIETYSISSGATQVEHQTERDEREIWNLIQQGFVLLQPGIPKRFSVVNRDLPMYVSVHDGHHLLFKDVPVHPSEYGCVSIKQDEHGVIIQPSNPSPAWLSCRQGDPIPDRAMRASPVNSSEQMYLGRSKGKLCFMHSKGGRCDFWLSWFDEDYSKHLSGDLLVDTGFDVVQARKGDAVLPNTLHVSGVYVGRIFRGYLCPINTRDAKVRDFLSIFKIKNRQGEIVVMTNDPQT